MVNRDLFKKIQTAKEATLQAHYAAIDRIRSDHGKAISREEAAYIYAAGLGIDIHRYLKSEGQSIQESVKGLITRRKTSPSPVARKTRLSKTEIVRVLKVGSTQIRSGVVPPEVLQNAFQMSNVYPLIFVFENSLRLFMKEVLDVAFPNGWWNQSQMPSEVHKRAEQRKLDEGKNLWHGKRTTSASMLDYVDLDELESILNKRTNEFTPFFKDMPKSLDWIKLKIKEAYQSRNVIAHCNPLGKQDIKRVEVIVTDWLTQLPALRANLKH